MNINELEEEIILAIRNKEVSNINNFLLKFISTELKEYKPINPLNQHALCGHMIKSGEEYFLAMDDSDVIIKLQIFIEIWKKLEKLNFIISVPYTKKLIPIASSETSDKTFLKPIEHILSISDKFINKQIIPDERKLNLYLQNGCKTLEEHEKIKEKRFNRNAQIFSIIAVLITLTISFRSCLLNPEPEDTMLDKSIIKKDTVKTIEIKTNALVDSLSIKEKFNLEK
jgi:hypothetical protein